MILILMIDIDDLILKCLSLQVHLGALPANYDTIYLFVGRYRLKRVGTFGSAFIILKIPTYLQFAYACSMPLTEFLSLGNSRNVRPI